jgi:hypothetical protein
MTGFPALRIGLVFLIAAATVAAQDRPLPDAQSFLAEARKRLQTDSALRSSYVYVETRREQKLDKSGRAAEESVKVFESYPGLPGEERWERLIAVNGRPAPAEELVEQDRDRQKSASIKRLVVNATTPSPTFFTSSTSACSDANKSNGTTRSPSR